MKYYINSIEQISQEGTHSEYSNTEKVNEYNSALSKFFTKLSNVAADIGAGHTFMYIEILNSTGARVKSDIVGTYIDDDAPSSEPEPEE